MAKGVSYAPQTIRRTHLNYQHLQLGCYFPYGIKPVCSEQTHHKPLPHHVTFEDVDSFIELVQVKTITGHQMVWRHGGKIAVTCETRWEVLMRVTWARKQTFNNSSCIGQANIRSTNSLLHAIAPSVVAGQHDSLCFSLVKRT